MTEPIRILLADDHTIVRKGVRLLLEAESDMEVVGDALSGQEAVVLTEALKPDVVLMDISMSGMDGLSATRQIRESCPETRILALTMHREAEYLLEMLEAGACGYIVKNADPDELLQAVRVVSRGQVFLYPTVAGKLVKAYLAQRKRTEINIPQLSLREREVLQLLAQGFSVKEIAEHLFISPSTVHTHRSNLMTKLELASRRDLVRYAQEHGFV